MSALTATEVVLGALTATTTSYADTAHDIVAALEAAGYIRRESPQEQAERLREERRKLDQERYEQFQESARKSFAGLNATMNDTNN